ncbi:glycosyltransferase family 4 protein [Geminocystis sp. NIES-3709]|uniref:glycosyltransferase family 4 protein n=1 Tax=Geminocystis sp. NIES-3709 TaxID=1617448 RepID=UPI0005FC6847|nr:glycosyltransferase family 4 protein [Geminocystis sp. NIES-3709]BAQ64651.1 glycosyltransferase [Geminocystis sp. NIES-3709]
MLVIISQYFYPSHASTSQLLTDLADGLFRENIPLKVYTGTPSNHQEIKPFQIVRSPDPFQNSKSIFGKLISSVFFLVGALFYVTFKLNRKDDLLIASNPPYAGIIGMVFRFLRSGKYYFLLQDVFPESAILSGIIKPKSKLIFIFNKLIYLICRYSEKTIILSESMKKLMQSKYLDLDNLEIIENWAIENIPLSDKKTNPFAIKNGLNEKFTALYSGNIGRLHDIETLAETIKILNEKQVNIQFVFIGDGAKLKLLENYQSQYNLQNLLLLPFQSRELLPQTLTACDVSLVSLIKGAESVVAPCKLYGMLASGRAIVSISEQGSYIEQMVTTEKCGINSLCGDAQKLADILIELSHSPDEVKNMGINAHKLYLKRYTVDRALKEYQKVLC